MKITKLESVRRDASMTKAQLAEKAGVQPNVIGWIESRRWNPYPVQLERIASVLGVAVPESLLEEVEV